MSQEVEEDQDILHFGNLISIRSTQYGYTKGRIIYRSADMVRIMPDEASDRAVEFPWDEDGGQFSPDLGVTAVEVYEIKTYPFYVDFLGAKPGELLEFFDRNGAEAAPSGEVEEILKGGVDEEEDAIKLTDGRILPFYGVGPPEPIIVVRVRTSLNAPAALEVGVGEGEGEDAGAAVAAAARQQSIMNLLRSILPSAAVEMIPTAERTYPDSLQREGLFQDLLADLPAKKQTNPNTIRRIEREVDTLVALKNKAIQRESSGRIIGTSPYQIVTVNDAVINGGIPSAIPIVQGARVLNLDIVNADEGVTIKDTDVAPRTISDVENDSEERATMYLDGAQSEAIGGVNAFYAYTQNLLGRSLSSLEGVVEGDGWSTDQDVIRTAGLGAKVQGLSKGLPRSEDSKGKSIYISTAMLISDVTDRAIRVLGADRIHQRKTGVTHIAAPSDPNHIVGYVMLPPKAALQLRPPSIPGDLPTALIYSAALEADNLPTIAQTLRDLYSSEESAQNAWTLTAENAASLQVADWLESVLRFTVHPVDSQGPRGPRLLSLLDTLGLGTTDMSPAVANVINSWVSKSQKTWIKLMKARRVEIQAALDTEQPRTFQSVVGVDSPLWAALRSADSLKELLEDIGRRNPTIAEAPTLMTASLLVEAQGDATPIVWAEIAKLDTRELAGIDIVTATAALAASRAYTLRRAALRSRDLVAMHAIPEVNPCVHTNRLEAIRNVSDVLEQARLLRAFIEEFQGPAVGSWISCVLCKKECVCYHELMHLEALAQPARMDAIHKQLLIKYGGDRYEGKIVCKNCGQALQEIDYDEHVEFDDNGKPIQQSSVLTAEQMEETTDSSSLKKILAPPEITFESQTHREIADGLTDLITHARLTLPPDVFRRIVSHTEIYVGRRAPDEAKYTATMSRKATSATTKFKKTTGMEGVVADLPTYAETIDQLRVSALIALTTIAIQTQDVTVATALPHCKFSREGYPFNPGAKPDATGALLYMACAAADIKQKKKPWLSMSWVGDTKFETRQKKALQIGYTAVNIILGADPKSAASLSFTPQIRMEMTKAQTDVEAAKERSLVSLKDELPVGFRPEPRPTATRGPATERNPLPALEAALSEGKMPKAATEEVNIAVRQQAIATVVDLHTESQDKTAGMCCPVPLGTAVTAGKKPLVLAAHLLRHAQATAANTGTHLWPTLETPHLEAITQDVDDGVLFKLFLKYCYQGPAVGNSHEFSAGNICRQCGLALGTPVDLIDFGRDGAGILAAQQGPLHIEITRPAFDALSDAVRRRKIIAEAAIAAVAADKSGLTELLAVCRPEVAEILGPILAAEPAKDELGRAEQWGPLSEYMTDRAAATDIELSMLEILTEDPFVEGPRALQEYWCAKTQAAGAAYAVTKVTGARWFKISKEHNDIINKILSENATWYKGTVTDVMKPVLLRIGKTLGPILNVWIQKVRPDAKRWSVAEAQLLLRTLVVQVWADALTPTSWMYAEIPSGPERAAIVEDIRAWTVALMDYKKGPKDVEHRRGHVQEQFVKYSREAIQRILQQRAELERTSVVEEFENIKDDDLRAAELIKKNFRIGRWGVGKNLQKYDADLFEFENEQRKRMGIMDAPVDPGLMPDAGAAAAAQALVEPEAGYSVDQGADGDDY